MKILSKVSSIQSAFNEFENCFLLVIEASILIGLFSASFAIKAYVFF